MPPTVLPGGTSKPFFRSICPCFQVLNFGNNILHFISLTLCMTRVVAALFRLLCRVRPLHSTTVMPNSGKA